MKRALLITLALLAGCQQRVQHGLDELQANEIEALLNGSGIEARKVREGGRDARWAISVPADHTAAAIKLLADHDLPRQRADGFGEVFGRGSMVPTALEESALFIHALSGELSRTLASLDGVVNARVHLVASPTGPHPSYRQAVKPRASVLLKVRADRSEAVTASLEAIRALVAGSVEDLDPADVAVMVSELPASPAPPPAARTKSPARIALIVAALLIALLAAGLAFAVVHARKLRLRLASLPDDVEAEAPPVRKAA
jgi:type III secretion protein J